MSCSCCGCGCGLVSLASLTVASVAAGAIVKVAKR